MPISEAYQRVLEQVAERERRALVMRDELGMTFTEISAALGVSRQHAYLLWKHARTKAAQNGDAPKAG